ncbi:MAG TPA: SMP-30/gluconolactonase/LRE family protein [Microlunatus sp.]|nr:SMP-30/gluconolactonase/LRE family protein [Microlunatus sp.]
MPSQPAAIPAEFVTLDERFAGTGGDRWLSRVFDQGRWLEGPAYHAAGRFVLFRDIPNDRVLRYDEVTGQVTEFDTRVGFTNGRTTDAESRFLACEHGHRRVTRTEHDGSTTVLADRFDGRRLNSPNDVVVAGDGAVWFTDPSYGIMTDYEGHAAVEEIGSRNVYRLDPSGELTVAADDFTQPNGLAFSADFARLYVVDSEEGHIRVFDVDAGSLTGGEVYAADPDGYDGIRFDSRGRLWGAAQDGLHCYEPDGTLSGKLLVPETVANFCFGGRQYNQLYLTATTSLYTARVNFTGLRYF